MNVIVKSLIENNIRHNLFLKIEQYIYIIFRPLFFCKTFLFYFIVNECYS